MKWKLLTVLASMAVMPAANAGGTYSGIVKPLLYSNTLYLNIGATQMSGRPSCAVRPYVRLREDPTDPVFKQKYTAILAAYLAGKPLVLSGDGTCTGEGDEVVFVVDFQ